MAQFNLSQIPNQGAGDRSQIGFFNLKNDKEEAVETTSAKQSEDDKGLEHFIKPHQPPPSKTIYK